MRQAALLWLVLFGAYAATVGIDATPGHGSAPQEARVLLAVESITSDGDVDLRDEYRAEAWSAWTAEPLRPVAGLTGGRLHEPPGVGLPLLLAPAYALAGPTGAELLMAALLALGFVAGAALARRLVPDPWATGAAVALGLSPPALAWSTTLAAEPVAAAAIAGAAHFALRVREEPRFWRAVLTALLIGLLPWLSLAFLAVGIACALALARWLRRRSRGLVAFAALEVVLVPAVVLITVNERLYGGLTPYAAVAEPPTGARGVLEHLERAPHLLTALLDPGAGLLVLAPAAILAIVALALLARALRERLALTLPGVGDMAMAAVFLAGLCVLQLVVAAIAAPAIEGPWYPGRLLVAVLPLAAALAAWGLRHAPRAGGTLCAATVAAGAWLVLGGLVGDATLAPPRGPLPWGGAGVAATVAVAATLTALLGRELWRARELMVRPRDPRAAAANGRF